MWKGTTKSHMHHRDLKETIINQRILELDVGRELERTKNIKKYQDSRVGPGQKTENKETKQRFFEHVFLCFSPPVRWGLLDFMWALSSASSSFSSSFSASSCLPRHQLRWCVLSVPCRTSTAIMWAQCSVPDLNRDPVSSVFRAGPQPRSCEFSVPRRTSTAILWGQCSAPDLNRDQKKCQKECHKICQKECQKKC